MQEVKAHFIVRIGLGPTRGTCMLEEEAHTLRRSEKITHVTALEHKCMYHTHGRIRTQMREQFFTRVQNTFYRMNIFLVP